MDFSQYKYIPRNVELTLDQNYMFRDGSVLYLNIIHDFKKRKMPVIQFGIEMETGLIKLLYQYKDTATLKLEIYEQESRGEKILKTELYLQHTFSIVPARDQTVYITADDTNTEGLTDQMKKLQCVELYLIDMDAVNWFSKEISAIYKKTTHAEALHAVFLERDIPPKMVIATPPMQNEKLENVALPLQDLVHNIYHLNTTYGLYDCTPIVYYDLTTLYCISKRNPDISIPSVTEFGNVAFILLDPTDPAREVTGSADDPENKTHWINLQTAPSIFDESIKDTSSKFSTIASVDAKGTVNKTTLNEKATAMKYIYANNSLTESQVLNESIYGHTVAVKAVNTCARFIKPYKDYAFAVGQSYMNLDLAGNIYRLLGWVLGIHREGMESYISEISLTLYKPERRVSADEVAPETKDTKNSGGA